MAIDSNHETEIYTLAFRGVRVSFRRTIIINLSTDIVRRTKVPSVTKRLNIMAFTWQNTSPKIQSWAISVIMVNGIHTMAVKTSAIAKVASKMFIADRIAGF